MCALSASIRRKPDWWTKRLQPEIRAKWRKEALSTRMYWNERANELVPLEVARAKHSELNDNYIVQINEHQVDYVLDELERYARLRDEEPGIQVRLYIGDRRSPEFTLVS